LTKIKDSKKFEDAYALYSPAMFAYAASKMDGGGEDVVHDTFLEVMALPTLPDGDIEGLLVQRLKWRIKDALRARQEVLECELGSVDDDGQDRPMELGDLEEVQSEHGRSPPWPTAVNYDTPEELVSASQMRDKIREIAVRTCGDNDYAVFCASQIDQMPQWRVAKEFHMDQATVSRVVARVRRAVADELSLEGYDVTG
jgi:RNA polymerase sigma factor (sigma-70 family)